MTTAVCPNCNAPVPRSLAQCPACGYAGTIHLPKGAFRGPSARTRVGAVLVALLAVGGRCGWQFVRAADDVVGVVDLADGFDTYDPADYTLPPWPDDPYGATSVPTPYSVVPYLPGEYRLAGGVGSVYFPAELTLTTDREVLADGRTLLTVEAGPYLVREVLTTYGNDPSPAGFHDLVVELADDVDASLGDEVETTWSDRRALSAHLDAPDRSVDVVVFETGTHYVELVAVADAGQPTAIDDLLGRVVLGNF